MKTLLNVESKEVDGQVVLDWTFGENINAYYLIGVLHVIEEALVRCIEDETNEEEDETNEEEGD